METMKDYALYYAKYFPVYPLSPNSAIPIKNSKGFNEASQIKNEIDRLFDSAGPNCNIGASFIGTDYFVVDIDMKHGKNGVKSLKKIMPDTVEGLGKAPIVRTRNDGYHFYFRTTEKIENKTDWLTGVDIIKNGLVLPPSRGFNEAGKLKAYRFQGKKTLEDIPEAPNWLLEAILASQEESKKELYKADKVDSFEMFDRKKYTASFMETLLDGAEPGNRNNWLTQQTGRLFGLGMESSYVYEWVHHINIHFLNDPLPDDEVNTIFKSILSRENKKRKGVL